jgi:hypothetical protein
MLLILTIACTSQAEPESNPGHQTFSSTAERPLDYSPVRTDLSDSTYTGDCPVGEQDDGFGGCAPCTDYEGCFTESADMSYFFSQIVKWIRQYSANTYKSMPDPDKWHFVTLGDSGFEGCTSPAGDRATYTDQSSEYCPFDRIIYVGEWMMWAFYTSMGDAAPAVGVAHEWGHHLQNVPISLPPPSSKQSTSKTRPTASPAPGPDGWWRRKSWSRTTSATLGLYLSQSGLSRLPAVTTERSRNDKNRSSTD